MILDGVCATKKIWSEYVLVTIWLHFGYILVTWIFRIRIGWRSAVTCQPTALDLSAA